VSALREAARALAGRLSAAGTGDATLEAEVIVRTAAGLSREQFYAGGCGDLSTLPELVERRLAREPLAYITGSREFYGNSFAVGPDVLIPRPESELLVELALQRLTERPRGRVLDVGTGSGCIACSVALHRQDGGRTIACDISEGALRLARQNATKLQAPIDLMRSDLAAAVGGAEVVVANLPYVASGVIGTLAPEVRDWEPTLALDGGCDGLLLVRQLIADCATRLRPGFLALEIDPAQATAVASALGEGGATGVRIHRDLANRDRVVSAQWAE
jgi:release factor glutamine methyltransferase